MTRLDLGFERRGERTVLARRVFRWPYVVMRPFWLDVAPAHMATVIVQSSSGAVQRGDRLEQRIEVGAQAAAHVTTQGAQPVHAGAGRVVSQETTTLRVGCGGYLEYLPEPRVLFPDADLVADVDLDCSGDGVALIADAFSWYDPTQASRPPRRFCSTASIRIGGGPALSIDRSDIVDFAARGPGFKAFGFMSLVAPAHALDQACADANTALERIGGLYAAASPLPGSLGVGLRFAGRDLRAVRAGLKFAWGWSRLLMTGTAPAGRRKD